MSRHRDVRSMNYSEEYDGYDDVYGHSVEDDYCVSPGAEQFLFDRNKQQNMSSYFTEPDIAEETIAPEDQESERAKLTELESAKLISCMEAIKNVIGESALLLQPQAALTERIISSNFNAEIVLDGLLNEMPPKSSDGETAQSNKDRPDVHTGFFSKNSPHSKSSILATRKFPFGSGNKRLIRDENSPMGNVAPTVSSKLASLVSPNKFSIGSSHVNSNTTKFSSSSRTPEQGKKSFGTLADLTAHHLQKSPAINDVLKSPAPSDVSSKQNFFIPKLLATKGENEQSRQLETATTNLRLINSNHQPVNLTNKFLNLSVAENSQEQMDKEHFNENEIKGESLIDENWTIDLTTALRQTKDSVNRAGQKKGEKIDDMTLVKMDDDDIDQPQSIILSMNKSSGIEEKINIAVTLECKFNLIYLRYLKLTNSNKTASSFGKMLCKHWNSRKLSIKKNKRSFEYDDVKRFDFSTPSPDSLILAQLRRR